MIVVGLTNRTDWLASSTSLFNHHVCAVVGIMVCPSGALCFQRIKLFKLVSTVLVSVGSQFNL